MTPSKPINIDGKTYDLYSMNLIVSSNYNAESKEDASIVCNFIPTRIADGVVETAPEATVNLRIGSLNQADQETLNAVTAIQTTIQLFINEKGI